MINADLEQFLDTGWFNEATLYYEGHTYWLEGVFNHRKAKPMHFFVYRYASDLFIAEDGSTFTRRKIIDGEVVDYSTVLECDGYGEEDVKETFLKSPIFDGKTFWEVEPFIAYYDEE